MRFSKAEVELSHSGVSLGLQKTTEVTCFLLLCSRSLKDLLWFNNSILYFHFRLISILQIFGRHFVIVNVNSEINFIFMYITF